MMRDQTHKHSGRNNATNWLERFESSRREVSAMFGADFVRMWRLYLAGTVAGFHVGIMQLFQIVFARNDSGQVPRTRAHLYQQDPVAAHKRCEAHLQDLE